MQRPEEADRGRGSVLGWPGLEAREGQPVGPGRLRMLCEVAARDAQQYALGDLKAGEVKGAVDEPRRVRRAAPRETLIDRRGKPDRIDAQGAVDRNAVGLQEGEQGLGKLLRLAEVGIGKVRDDDVASGRREGVDKPAAARIEDAEDIHQQQGGLRHALRHLLLSV